jgi:tetratricopeptide (TPR) repeat protein
MTAGRYSDAVGEFLGAQGVVPGDAAAVKGQKDAEQKLADAKADAKNMDDFNRLVDNAKSALSNKKYDEAIGGALAALRLMPGDAGATKLLDDAKKAKDAAKTEYDRIMTAAATARAAQRYEEAKGLYAQALQIAPGDTAALKGQQDIQNQFDGQAAYNRFMLAGAQAMSLNRFGDAATAFTEALRLAPNDPAATKGLADAQAALARIADYNRFMTIGNAALNKKAYNDAVAAFRDALVALPDDPVAIAGLKQAKYQRAMVDGEKAMLAIPKKFNEAIADYELALKEIPGDKTAKEQLSNARYLRAIQDGTAFMAAKKWAEAVPQFEDALKERPKDVDATIKLHDCKYNRAMADGDAAMKAQKYDDAITAYQDALKVTPNDGKATKGLELAKKMKK